MYVSHMQIVGHRGRKHFHVIRLYRQSKTISANSKHNTTSKWDIILSALTLKGLDGSSGCSWWPRRQRQLSMVLLNELKWRCWVAAYGCFIFFSLLNLFISIRQLNEKFPLWRFSTCGCSSAHAICFAFNWSRIAHLLQSAAYGNLDPKIKFEFLSLRFGAALNVNLRLFEQQQKRSMLTC